jgi:site-specific recombinase XerD
LLATAEHARDYAERAHAPNTRRAYRADLAHFGAWCAARSLEPLPADPATVALYFTHLADAGAKLATIRRRVAAINGVHAERGLEKPSAHPEVRRVLRGIANTIGAPPVRKDALTIELLRQALGTLDGSLKGTRDRAILLLGFAGAFRRSELAALDVADLRFSRRGLCVTLRRSKTDQGGEGREVAIPQTPVAAVCPVRAVKAWLQVARIDDGPLFRGVGKQGVTNDRISDASVARLVKRLAGAAGLSGDFAAHSLRAGFVTSAAERKVADRDIARVTGHKSMAILGSYVRRANVFDAPALLEIVR